MAERPGAARARDIIVARAWPGGVYLSDRAVDCHARRLRRKLREAGAGDDAIETVYGLGYRLRRMKKLRAPIVARILGLNSLLVFLPVAAFLSLDTYERSLLSALEDSLVQQGRFLAAWLGEGEMDDRRAEAVLAALGRRHTARLRVLDAAGNLLADSSVLGGSARAEASGLEGGAGGDRESEPASDLRAAPDSAPEPAKAPRAVTTSAESSWVYRLLSSPVRLWRRYLAPPSEPLASADFYAGKRSFLEGAEVRAALEGGYGAATRISAGGQVSVTLYSALPVADPAGRVRGGPGLPVDLPHPDRPVPAPPGRGPHLSDQPRGLRGLELPSVADHLAALEAPGSPGPGGPQPPGSGGGPLRAGGGVRRDRGLGGGAEGVFRPPGGAALLGGGLRLGPVPRDPQPPGLDPGGGGTGPGSRPGGAPGPGGPHSPGRGPGGPDRGGLRELSRIEGGEEGTGPSDVLEVARNCADRAAASPEALAKGLGFRVDPLAGRGSPPGRHIPGPPGPGPGSPAGQRGLLQPRGCCSRDPRGPGPGGGGGTDPAVRPGPGAGHSSRAPGPDFRALLQLPPRRRPLASGARTGHGPGA
ncbi:MAG: helix-turn-helix domain-containing protein [Desulfobacterales bacterium]|nr:helix-turn-helix domain-containing protein [Desulfobacterales bacterium]